MTRAEFDRLVVALAGPYFVRYEVPATGKHAGRTLLYVKHVDGSYVITPRSAPAWAQEAIRYAGRTINGKWAYVLEVQP